MLSLCFFEFSTMFSSDITSSRESYTLISNGSTNCRCGWESGFTPRSHCGCTNHASEKSWKRFNFPPQFIQPLLLLVQLRCWLWEATSIINRLFLILLAIALMNTSIVSLASYTINSKAWSHVPCNQNLFSFFQIASPHLLEFLDITFYMILLFLYNVNH